MKMLSSAKRRSGRYVPLAAIFVLLPVLASCSLVQPVAPTSNSTGIHKIKHIIIIFQENRSFDSYFGTYPGADGIPMQNGVPTVCVNDPRTGQCVKPFADHQDVNGGGPHAAEASLADVNNGAMNGFIQQAEQGKKGCTDPTNPACTNSATPDVMGYHTGSDIPNYWTYAKDFVLQDHMYESVASWSFRRISSSFRPGRLTAPSQWTRRAARAPSCRATVPSPIPRPSRGQTSPGC